MLPRERKAAQNLTAEVRRQQRHNEQLGERSSRKRMIPSCVQSSQAFTQTTAQTCEGKWTTIYQSLLAIQAVYTQSASADPSHTRTSRYCGRYFSQLRMDMCKRKPDSDYASLAEMMRTFHPPGGAKEYLARVRTGSAATNNRLALFNFAMCAMLPFGHYFMRNDCTYRSVVRASY